MFGPCWMTHSKLTNLRVLEQNGLDDEPQVLVDEALSKEYEKQPEELASIGKPNQ